MSDLGRGGGAFAFDVFSLVPQGHEKALKQAFYTAAAGVFVGFLLLATVAVYFILEPFLRPLLWAVLFGSVLHPSKHSLTLLLRGWLHQLTASRTPLVLGIVSSPLLLADRTTQRVAAYLLAHFRPIAAVSAATLVLLTAVYLLPDRLIVCIFSVGGLLLTAVARLLELVGAAGLVVWTLVLGYLLLVWLWWSPQTEFTLSCVAHAVWIFVICHLSTVAGTLRIPIFFCIVLLLIVGSVAHIKDTNSAETQEVQDTEEAVSSTGPFHALKSAWQWLMRQNQNTSEPIAVEPSDEQAAQRVQVELGTPERTRPALRLQSVSLATTRKDSSKTHKLSNLYLSGLLWTCLLAQLWLHLWLLNLLPIPIVYILVKYVGHQCGVWQFIADRASNTWFIIFDWCETRKDVLVPPPIRGMTRLLAQGDRKIVSFLESSLDTFTSIGVILTMAVAAILAAIFLIVQIYGESMHLVDVTGSLINRTIVHNPEILELLPESLQDVQGTLDTMLGDAYLYGREWISTTVRRIIDEKDQSRAAAIEKQLLEVWDRVYHLWITRNDTAATQLQNSSASWQNLLDGLKTLDITLLLNFVKENIGTFMAVLDSVWTVLKSNISVALSAVTATLSIVFGGGTAVLNFLLNLVIFSTALFYLLCASGEQYKPIELFGRMLPSFSSSRDTRLGEAVEEAINGVFAASFKMATFYGLYTWLIHTLFDVKIIYIPSVLAAVCGAVPFLGPYWACLPAVLELWLVQGQTARAVLMLICQLLPTSFVDTAVYREIKGGGHPYLTGLAIAGGVFCLGFEGALFGPMLLCVLIVAINMYGSMMEETPTTDSAQSGRRAMFKRMNTTQ